MTQPRVLSCLLAFVLCTSLIPPNLSASLVEAQGAQLDLLDPSDVVSEAVPEQEPAALDFRPGELLVRFGPTAGARLAQRQADGRSLVQTGLSQLDHLAQEYGLQSARPVFAARTAARPLAGAAPDPLADVYHLTFTKSVDVEALADAYNASAWVTYAEPDYVYTYDATPDDPGYDQQWYLMNDDGWYNDLEDADIDAPEAWDIFTGTGNIVIAVIDTGIDRDHADLTNRIWTNPGEMPDNGTDDDGNGYVDDTWGWNWVSDLSDPDDFDFDDPRDDNGHGTHVAGIAAAEADNEIGIAGVCWDCRVMSLKAFEANGTGTTSDIVQAIDYAVDKGADIINMSFGSYSYSQLVEDTLAAAYGQALLVAAAGNGILGKGTSLPLYPAAIPYVMGVGASDVQCVERNLSNWECITTAEAKAPFSNYGANADLCAPGVSIYSTYPGGYASMAGTSMATPIVAGTAALLMTQNPTWSKEAYRGQLIHTTDSLFTSDAFPACGSGRVNAYNALITTPEPELEVLGDEAVYDDSGGDGDGVPDAGESIGLVIPIKNYWGEAAGVTGTLSTSDSYVTLTDGEGTWGDISAYATLTNEGDPFAITLDTATPNNHLIEFSLDLTGNGGAYSLVADFSFRAQRGIEIPDPLFPAVITESMTLDSDYLYIVTQNMLVAEGVTLTIEPGTRLQFDPDKMMVIQGTLIASGTEELPIVLSSNAADPQPGDFKGLTFDDQSVDATLVPTPTLEIAAAEGEVVEGLGSVISMTIAPQMDAAGRIYFGAEIGGDLGLYRYTSGARVETLVLAGQNAPDGGQFSSFSDLAVTRGGVVHFIADLTGATATSGVFRLDLGALETIALEGDLVPESETVSFTGFKELAAIEAHEDSNQSSYVAFVGFNDGSPGVGLYIKRVELAYLIEVDTSTLSSYGLGTLLDVRNVWAAAHETGPRATYVASGGTILIRAEWMAYDPVWYDDIIRWRSDTGTPVGGSYQPGPNDRQAYVGDTKDQDWYTLASVSGGAADHVLVRCEYFSNCDQPDQLIASHGDPLPGGGQLDLSGPVAFGYDGVHPYFTAVVSGTDTVRLVKVLEDGTLAEVHSEGDSLPDAGASTGLDLLPIEPFVSRFGEFALLVGSPGGQRLIRGEPSLEYVSGSILSHAMLEYGGGVLVDDSFPYIADVTVRQSMGAIPPGSSYFHGALTVYRTELGDPGHLVVRDSEFRDNPSHGVYLYSTGPGWVTLTDDLIYNNEILSFQVVDSSSGAGAYVSTISSGVQLSVMLRRTSLQYNRPRYTCSALRITQYEAEEIRLVGNDIRNNRAALEQGTSNGAVCVASGSAALVGNLLANNTVTCGYQPGDSAATYSGSALALHGSQVLGAYNTLSGNRAPLAADPYTEWGLTILDVQYDVRGQRSSWTLGNIVDNEASYDLYLSNYGGYRRDWDVIHNYWGTTEYNEIQYDSIYDYYQDFQPGVAYFQPYLTAPEPKAPGFVWTASTFPPDPVGRETMTVTVDFSREMNTAITPTVTFGVDEPYTQNAIEDGTWISPTQYVGSFPVEVWTGDGINTLRVVDAQDGGGMEIPEFTGHQFVIQTAGTASGVLLEGSAGLGYVHLNWNESQLDNLAGYVVYRSPLTNTAYSPLVTVLTTSYTDTEVSNNTLYYYKYAVLTTDLEEVAESNEISLVPDDVTLPETPTVTDDGASTHYFDRLHATWYSADPDTGIAEYQLCIGTAAGSCDTVSWTSMGTLTETTRTGLALVDNDTYFFNVKARNGADHWSEVGSSDGILMDKLPPPVITGVEPITGVRTTSHVITLTGSGFQATPLPLVELGSTVLGEVAVQSEAQLTALVPAWLPAGVYDLGVTNYDTQQGVLSQAYTVTNPTVGPRPLVLSPSSQQVGDDEGSFTVDVEIQDVTDLAAFQFDLNYDPVVVHATDVTLGAFLSSGGLTTVPLGPDIDNVAGTLTFGGFGYGGGYGASGTGTLATITMEPQTAGDSGLAFANVQLRDSLNSEIPADPQEGSVQVVTYPFGDLDRDCDVDVADIMTVASRWNSFSGDGTYDPAYDFDSDGDIDVFDVMAVAIAWGDTCGVESASSPLDGELPAASFEVTPASALAATATVAIDPATTDLDTGTTYTLAVTVAGAEDLGGFQFDLIYDPAMVQVDDAELGPFLGSTGRNVGELGPVIDNVEGTLTYGGFSFGSDPGPSGDGVLAVVTYTTQGDPGETTLSLEAVQLIDTTATQQPADAFGAVYTLLTGPRVGTPVYDSSVASDQPLTIVVPITNTTSGSGVVSATLVYGYVDPYEAASVSGTGPGGDGNGDWSFELPPQGDTYEGQTLYFWLRAEDGDDPSGVTAETADGSYYGVDITDDDVEPPAFSNPGPTWVLGVDTVTLQVDINDAESGIQDNEQPDASVYLLWDTDGELTVDANQADMDWSAGDTYLLDTPIGPFGEGITVTWQVYAADDDNSPAGAWSSIYEIVCRDTIFGDLDYDCDVDVDDIMIVVGHWNSVSGEPEYDEDYDFDDDGDIDVEDVMKVAAVWGDTCAYSSSADRLPRATAQDGPILRFEPATAVAPSSGSVTVDLLVDGVADLGGFEVDLLFEHDLVTVTQVLPGDFLASSGNDAQALGPMLAEDGRLIFGGFSFGAEPGADGTGVLATLELALLGDEGTIVNLGDVQLVSIGGEVIAAGSIGELRVEPGYTVYLPLVLR